MEAAGLLLQDVLVLLDALKEEQQRELVDRLQKRPSLPTPFLPSPRDWVVLARRGGLEQEAVDQSQRGWMLEKGSISDSVCQRMVEDWF
jgi:hypothetical protein